MTDTTPDDAPRFEGVSIVTGRLIAGTDPQDTHPYPDGRAVTRLYRPDTGKSSDVFTDTLHKAAPESDTRVTSTHWHVSRHAEDDEIFADPDLFAALDYAATELDRMADHEYDGITAAGEAGAFEEAYRTFVRYTRLCGLAANAHTAHRQGTLPREERAPLYQDPDESVNRRRAEEYARRTVDTINEQASDFRVWECTETECAPTED